MGIDIIAYGQVTKISDLPCNSTGEIDWRAVEDIDPSQVLIKREEYPNHCTDLSNGVYKYSKYLGGNGMTYGSYADIRDLLAQYAMQCSADEVVLNPEPNKNKPFFTLISFPVLNGVLGTKDCATLYADFEQNEAAFLQFASKSNFDPLSLKDYYSEFKQAFEVAQNGGYVNLR